MSERFKVVEGSESAHCCFKATVVDTLRPVIMHGKPYHRPDGEPEFETMCECFDADDARRIASALNRNRTPTKSTEETA